MQTTDQIKLVILESPFAGKTPEEQQANITYARTCALHCALQGEASQASHLYYTQFLEDTNTEERALGIRLGLAWTRVADYQVFYTDRGWSKGMLYALSQAIIRSRPFKIRALHSAPRLPDGTWSEQELRLFLDSMETVELRTER